MRRASVRGEVRIAAAEVLLVAPVAGVEVADRHGGAAGDRLEVQHGDRGAHDVAQAEEPRVEAEHDVAAAQHEALVEAADAARRPTRSTATQAAVTESESRYQSVGPSSVSRVGLHADEEVVGEAVHADDDTTVLDAAVGVDQLEAHEADVGLHRPPDHLAAASRVDAARCRR